MARTIGRFGFGAAAAVWLALGAAALLCFGLRGGGYLLDGIPAAERKLRRAELKGNVLRKGARVLHGITRGFGLGSSNLIQRTALTLEERAKRNETIAAIDLQLNQCHLVVTNYGTRDCAEEFARSLRAGGIQAVFSWPLGDQGPNWHKGAYSVKVSSIDRERAMELLSRQSRAFHLKGRAT